MGLNQNRGSYLNILLTGGHGATTGIAVIQALRKRLPLATISWIGTNTVISGSKATSLEYKIYPSMGVKYYSINAGKLQTKFTRHTISQLLLIPVGFVQAFFLLLKIRPRVILSFGGYSSFPVVFFAWCFRIPIVLHEQTVVAGRASALSAFFVNKIALSRIESLKYFPKEKCVVTGNPITSEVVAVKPKMSLGKIKTLLVIGGSRGSEFINEIVFKIRDSLTTKYKVIHVTGERDYAKYSSYSNSNYRVLEFVNPSEMAKVYSESDIIISRAGANSVAEIISIKRPAILIPLPRTFLNEQVKNAEYASTFGVAKVILESECTEERLKLEIDSLFNNWQKKVNDVSNKISPDAMASEKLTNLVIEYL